MLDLPPPDPGIEIVLATRGYSKGLAQTEGVQGLGKFELAFKSISFTAQYKNITSPTAAGEAAFGVGWRGKAAGFDLGATVSWKRLIGLDGQVDPDCWEFIPTVSHKIGPLTAKLSLTYSPDDLGRTGTSAWMEAGAAWKLDGKTSLVAAIGRREREGATDYTAFNAGVTRTLFEGVSAELRYYDSARRALGDPFQARLVGSLRARF
ncbi:MAG TPA: porin [Allosphingosinicella sp.]|nr:porin [Allosphingosinicella sp.]